MDPASPTAPTADGLERGSLFADRYRVVRRLKHGGMGSVFQVIDQRTDRLRALKIMQPEIATDPEMRERFEREASIVGRVRSDHLVEVVDAGVAEPNTPYLVMELLEGEDLGGVLEVRGALPPAEVIVLLEQVARAIDRVHAEGVVHRDLKPENLFLTRRDDGTQHVKVLDFGVAKVMSQSGKLSTTRSLGTPLYMAPEQLTGDGTIGPAADLYALAHVAFHLLCGRPYWHEEARSASNAFAFMSIVMRGAPEEASERAAKRSVVLPRAFDRWFEKATDKRPSRRFDSATEQIQALGEVLRAAPGVADAPTLVATPAGPRARRKRSRARYVLVAGGLSIAAISVGLALAGSSTEGRATPDGAASSSVASAAAATSPDELPSSRASSVPTATSASQTEAPPTSSSAQAPSTVAPGSARPGPQSGVPREATSSRATTSDTGGPRVEDPLDAY